MVSDEKMDEKMTVTDSNNKCESLCKDFVESASTIWRQMIKTVSSITDAMAEQGTDSLHLSKLYPSAEIIAIGKDRVIYEVLKQNISKSGSRSVRPRFWRDDIVHYFTPKRRSSDVIYLSQGRKSEVRLSCLANHLLDNDHVLIALVIKVHLSFQFHEFFMLLTRFKTISIQTVYSHPPPSLFQFTFPVTPVYRLVFVYVI
jgi:hypothetical protein